MICSTAFILITISTEVYNFQLVFHSLWIGKKNKEKIGDGEMG